MHTTTETLIRFEPLESQGYQADLLKGIPKANGERPVYIGDPCYVFPDEHWGALCKALDKGYERAKELDVSANQFVVYMNDKPVMVMGNTTHGDGVYPVKIDGEIIGEFGVDSGTFAMIPTHYIEQWNPDKKIRYFDDPESETYYGQTHFRIYPKRGKLSFNKKKCGDGILVSSNLEINTESFEMLRFPEELEDSERQMEFSFKDEVPVTTVSFQKALETLTAETEWTQEALLALPRGKAIGIYAEHTGLTRTLEIVA